MVDPDQAGEDFDDELLGGEFPPDEPLAAEDEGVTWAEELGGESVAEREQRTEPEVWESAEADAEDEDGPEVELVGDDAGVPDTEKDLVGGVEAEDEDRGPLAPDDAFSGDETTRDIADERVAPSAEDAAVHTEDEAPATP